MDGQLKDRQQKIMSRRGSVTQEGTLTTSARENSAVAPP